MANDRNINNLTASQNQKVIEILLTFIASAFSQTLGIFNCKSYSKGKNFFKYIAPLFFIFVLFLVFLLSFLSPGLPDWLF